MRSIYKNMLAVVLCLCLLSCNVCTVQAACTPDLTTLTFDMDYYYNTYADLQAAIGYDYKGLLNHYLTYGLKEGRWGSAQFNCLAYKARYTDLQAAFGSNLTAYCTHFETYGVKEGRSALDDGILADILAGASVNTSIPSSTSLTGEVMGTYSTTYDAEIPRAVNVTVSASRINGVVLQPGDSFSFSQTVLPRTSANGYVKAPVIAGGRFVPGMGGGICQVSSTLYAAMVDANLPATERHKHSLAVDYVPAELDATIAGNAKDLKFVNIFDHAIQIVAAADDGTLTVSICK